MDAALAPAGARNKPFSFGCLDHFRSVCREFSDQVALLPVKWIVALVDRGFVVAAIRAYEQVVSAVAGYDEG